MNYDRRNFLKLTGTATAGGLLSAMDCAAAKPFTPLKASAGYELKVLATNWGFDGSMDDYCAKAKKEGYDGIENWWPGTKEEQDEMFDAVKKHDLELGILFGAGETDAASHITTFKKTVDTIAKQTIKKLLYINLHSGKDYFSTDDNKKMIEHTLALAKETGVLICHETHRGRMMYSAPLTKAYLNQYADLKLTLDISHWCNVHESLLDDQKENIDAAIERTNHIHARVGYQEGPQVADPRAPEWEPQVNAHFAWWDRVVERKKKAGERITFLTEFGPPLYMQTLPYTLQPLSNQWEINVYMMQLLRKRYS